MRYLNFAAEKGKRFKILKFQNHFSASQYKLKDKSIVVLHGSGKMLQIKQHLIIFVYNLHTKKFDLWKIDTFKYNSF